MFELGQSVRVIHPHTGREIARGVVIHILRSRMGDEYTVKAHSRRRCRTDRDSFRTVFGQGPVMCAENMFLDDLWTELRNSIGTSRRAVCRSIVCVVLTVITKTQGSPQCPHNVFEKGSRGKWIFWMQGNAPTKQRWSNKSLIRYKTGVPRSAGQTQERQSEWYSSEVQ
jgi:hypothetical protein